MLLHEAEDLSGLWSNNSSSASLNDYPLPTTTSTPHHQLDYDSRPTSIKSSDMSVGDILEVYKHDTELLKYILKAKAEEDKRRAAEELRRTEEARLQSKYLDYESGQQKRFSDPSTFTNEFLSGSLGSLVVSSAEAVPDWLSFDPDNPINMISSSPMTVSLSQFDQTPPSPATSYYNRPPSPPPGTSFDVPFADLTISATSSPDLSDPTHKLAMNRNSVATSRTASSSSSSLPATVTPGARGIMDTNDLAQYNEDTLLPTVQSSRHDNTFDMDGSSASSKPSAPGNNPKSSCKRTLSRTRSQRRPVLAPGKKKNRSIPLPQQNRTQNEPQQLDHGTVMEALRAKLRRSSNPPLDGDKESSNSGNTATKSFTWTPSIEEVDFPPQPMSPQGMLLLDLKNPRKVFPMTDNKRRTSVNPRVAVVRRPKPFTSAHNHCEKVKDPSSTVSIKQ